MTGPGAITVQTRNKDSSTVEIRLTDNGRGTLPLMKAQRPELPVILATGLADDIALGLASQFSQVVVLAKPYEVAELRRLLNALAE